MSVIEKLNETLDKMNNFESLKTANNFIDKLKNNFRQRLGGHFLKVDFGKSENNNGVVFIRFAKASYTEACNDKLQEAPVNFIISVEGFDGEGGLCEECGCFVVETLKYHDPDRQVRRLNRRQLCDINMVEKYLSNYIEKYQEQLKEVCQEEATAQATSGIASSDVSGGSDTSNVAVHPYRHGETQKRKKRKVYGN